MESPVNEKAAPARAASHKNIQVHGLNNRQRLQEKLQCNVELHHWLQCLRQCERGFVLRFLVGKLLPMGAIDVDGVFWLIAALAAL